MKKAKIMLTSIAVIAIISGTLAFKAHQNARTADITYAFCPTTSSSCSTATVNAFTVTTESLGNTLITTRGAVDPTGALNGQSCTGNCVTSIYFNTLGQ